MLVLVTGGAASGKSEHAERIISGITEGPRLYLATMEPYGKEAQRRIKRHRRLREGKGFETLECASGIKYLELTKWYGGILLEDLGNLAANEMFSGPTAGGDMVSEILEGIEHLQKHCGILAVVTNEVFSDGMPYDADTTSYIEALGKLNTILGAEAEFVYESVCGILLKIKGAPTDAAGGGL